MNRQIEKFLKYIQTSSPFNDQGGVEYFWKEMKTGETSFDSLYHQWFPDDEGNVPVLENVTLEEFSKQIAVAFWSCFGWPGNKPQSSKAQREFINLLRANYDLGHINSALDDDPDGYGEIYFTIESGKSTIVSAISWSTD